MKIFLLLCLVTFSAQAANLESFFSSLEGGWKIESAQSMSWTPEGGMSTSVASRFDASVTRTDNRWSFAEEMCWSTDGAEDVCSEASVTWEVQGDLLFIVMGEEKLPVNVVDIDQNQLGIILKTKDFVFNAVIGISNGVLVQDGFTQMSNGASEYQSLRLLKQ